MASTIGLAVREDHSPSWPAGVAFLLGSADGGLFLALAAIGAGIVFRSFGGGTGLAFGLALFVLCLSLTEATRWRVRPFGPSRQVSRATLRRHGSILGSWLWGLELGLAFATRVNSWLVFALPLAIAMVPWNLGLVAGVTYGAVRGMQPLVTMASETPERCETTRLVSHAAGLLALVGSCSFAVLIIGGGLR